MDRKEKLQAIADKLAQGVKAVFDSERYREFLNTVSKFHSYSYRNTVLIAMQKPDAQQVAGFRSWQKNFERNVKKGEKGISILAPAPRKITQKTTDENGAEVLQEVVIPAYRVVTVFDVSQTEGKPLPTICNTLDGKSKDFENLFKALQTLAPCPISFEDITNGASGYYSPTENRIAVKSGMGELQTLKTTVHELAHSILHNLDAENKPDKSTKEVQAESVAYTVCQYLGLDTSDYSFGYIAGWSSGKELQELQVSLETIRNTAAAIIDGIEKELKTA